MRTSIDLVLVTGAGASREFGGNREPLPLMNDLSEALIRKLQVHPGYLEATRLESGLDGQEFERRLGTFLRAVLAFSRIDSVLEATATFAAQPGLATAHALVQWFEQSQFQLGQIVESIYEVLYEQLSVNRVAVHTASEAYRDLFEVLGMTPSSSVVLATTNYETVAELALATLGWHPDAGEERYAVARPDPPVSVDGLLYGMPRHVPVLHLHGCLGWYRRTDSEQVYFTSVAAHQRGLGVPVMVLPDPEKSYDADAIIASLWSQFEEALRATRRVLVLGHSLNDSALISALKRNVEGFDRVGIVVLPDPQSGAVSSIPPGVQAALDDLPGARPVPLRFASPLANTTGLGEWAKRTYELGPRPRTE